MSVRTVASKMIAVLCAALVCTLVLAGSASALFTHLYTSSFPVAPGYSHGLAVDESTEDIYLYDGLSVYKYSSAGTPLEFSAIKSDHLSVSGGSTRNTQLAVDNSSGSAKGDLYVADEEYVRIFSPDGTEVGRIEPSAISSLPPGQLWEPTAATIDSQGHVYASFVNGWNVGESLLSRFAPKSGAATDADYEASAKLFVPKGIAAGSSDVYVQEGEPGNILKFSPFEFGPASGVGTDVYRGGRSEGFAMDANEHLYVDERSEVTVTDTSGAPLEHIRPPATAPGYFNESHGIAVNRSNGYVYILDNSKTRVNVFVPALLPDVTTESPGLTTSLATLKGEVNPDGLATNCYFEYGTSTSYGNTVPCSTSPGSGSVPVEVSAEVSGLQPSTLYHFRLVATNANGTNEGEDETFALPFPPSIYGEQVTGVELSTAMVEASVDAMGYDSHFHVEYGLDATYGWVVPATDVPMGSSIEYRTVEQLLTGLLPNTTYHYRVAATNAIGTAYGPDQTFTTFAPPPPRTTDTCPNASARLGAGEALPDCRAFEMVSPVDKNGADIYSESDTILSSTSGERVEFATETGMANSHGSGDSGYTQFIATRGAHQWTTNAIDPTPAVTTPIQVFSAYTKVEAFSKSLESAVVRGYELPGGQAPPATESLYLENPESARLVETVSRFEEGLSEQIPAGSWTPDLRGSSADLGVVTFQSPFNLVAPATGTRTKLYALDHGRVRLVGVLPNGSVPANGSTAVRDLEAIKSNDTVSSDGSRIFFLAEAEGGGPTQLYMRKDGSATVLVSESESSAPEVAQGVTFQAATPDGAKVVFSTPTRLLDDDPGGRGEGVYLYTDGPQPQSESNLTFIARVNPVSNRHNIVKGISRDGTHVYFLSDYKETLPFQTEGRGLFLWDSGRVRQIAPQPGSAASEFAGLEEDGQAVVSADGRRIAFQDRNALTSDSVGLLPAEHTEVYLYDEGTDSLKCVSCPTTGGTATSGAETTVEVSGVAVYLHLEVQSRFLSEDGRFVFFNTSESLVPQDTNGVADAYEYDVATGKLSLLSPGTGEIGVWFVNADPMGKNAFLVTRAQLNRWDEDKLVDLYDARIDGGLPEKPAAPIECAGDACQGVPSAASRFDVASEFHGRGNPPGSGAMTQPKKKQLTEAQRLHRTLAACKHLKKRRWARCQASAWRRYRAKRSQRAGR